MEARRGNASQTRRAASCPSSCLRLSPTPHRPTLRQSRPGVSAKPKVACRLGVDAAFKSRLGTVGVPVTKVPGVVDFLEGIVNKVLTANLVWPRADVSDTDSYERDRSQPGTGRLRVVVLGAEALAPERVREAAEAMSKAEKEAAGPAAPPSPSKPPRESSGASYRAAAAKFSSGSFACVVKWRAGPPTQSPSCYRSRVRAALGTQDSRTRPSCLLRSQRRSVRASSAAGRSHIYSHAAAASPPRRQSGRKRRDVDVPAAGKAPRESDGVLVSMSDWPPGGDTKEALEFVIKNREEVPKNTPQDKFAAGACLHQQRSRF